MKVIEILRLGKEMLKLMSNCDIRTSDYKHIAMFDEYTNLRNKGEKVDYIICTLSDKYKLSESTVKRIVKRLSLEVK